MSTINFKCTYTNSDDGITTYIINILNESQVIGEVDFKFFAPSKSCYNLFEMFDHYGETVFLTKLFNFNMCFKNELIARMPELELYTPKILCLNRIEVKPEFRGKYPDLMDSLLKFSKSKIATSSTLIALDAFPLQYEASYDNEVEPTDEELESATLKLINYYKKSGFFSLSSKPTIMIAPGQLIIDVYDIEDTDTEDEPDTMKDNDHLNKVIENNISNTFNTGTMHALLIAIHYYLSNNDFDLTLSKYIPELFHNQLKSFKSSPVWSMMIQEDKFPMPEDHFNEISAELLCCLISIDNLKLIMKNPSALSKAIDNIISKKSERITNAVNSYTEDTELRTYLTKKLTLMLDEKFDQLEAVKQMMALMG